MPRIGNDHNLLFGVLALQNGLIDQAKLVAAFQAWTLAPDRPLADYLLARGDLDTDDRAAVEALVARHLKKHGGSAEKSLAAIPGCPAIRDSLALWDGSKIEDILACRDARDTSNERDVRDGNGEPRSTRSIHRVPSSGPTRSPRTRASLPGSTPRSGRSLAYCCPTLTGRGRLIRFPPAKAPSAASWGDTGLSARLRVAAWALSSRDGIPTSDALWHSRSSWITIVTGPTSSTALSRRPRSAASFNTLASCRSTSWGFCPTTAPSSP